MNTWQQLIQEIPLLQALDTSPYQLPSVAGASFLLAPIALHRNHKLTVFGGSISLLTTTLGWFHIAQQGQHATLPPLVIRSQQVEFVRLISNDALFNAYITEASQHRQRRRFKVTANVYNASTGILGATAKLEYVLLDD
ncbi:YiiD C-terminal domain-containing protein [Umboniibacter marinipuniceus]|uniref:Putative thioesterase YiiD n=1 Tax=Umboniibacter marinipuniceus TaxID=569599 RepID=A0A3M0AAE5_9GAMM|nr:YiiD C-terminal domain-containing protein [Umboniibacter marinipuniceus]RMA81184.1 putative thioesterase YiiD [Umboniibacter marinipuniceus]